jgi:hypothetical protein
MPDERSTPAKARADRVWRRLLQTASILCLLLAALLLAVDAREYPGLTRAGVRALSYGALPLLAVGVVNLIALNAGRRWRLAALAADAILLAVSLRDVAHGAPPYFWMRLAVAALLVAGVAGALLSSGGEAR